MAGDILNPRRAPRAPLRCAVEVRHRLASWHGETEDLGPSGCQLVSPRLVAPGREVKLAIFCDGVDQKVAVTGKVIWARDDEPPRLGVAFARGGIDRRTFDALVRSDPAAERAVRSVPDRLARPTRVYLGTPPADLDFTPAELELIRRVGSGVTLDALVRSFGPELYERTRGALFALVGRKVLVIDPAAAVGVALWGNVLPDRDRGRAPRPARTAPAQPTRPEEAQRLYDEALFHIGAGELTLAMERLRDALQHSPGDELIASTARRIARWA